MSRVRIQEAAALRLDDIYRHTRRQWGAAQAERISTIYLQRSVPLMAAQWLRTPFRQNSGLRVFSFAMSDTWCIGAGCAMATSVSCHHAVRKNASDETLSRSLERL